MDKFEGTKRFKVVADYHDTTTGKLRAAGKFVTADYDRAQRLKAAGVIGDSPLADGDMVDGDADQDDTPATGQQGHPDTLNAPLRVDDNAGGITSSAKALSTSDVPPAVLGRGRRHPVKASGPAPAPAARDPAGPDSPDGVDPVLTPGGNEATILDDNGDPLDPPEGVS